LVSQLRPPFVGGADQAIRASQEGKGMKIDMDPDPGDQIHIASCQLQNRAKALRFIAALRKVTDIVFPVEKKEPK
jgi:hypothetical protein